MERVDQELSAIAELIRRVMPAEAEKRCRVLITTLGADELRDVEAEIRATIGLFLKKRRAALFDLLDRTLAADEAAEQADRLAQHYTGEERWLFEEPVPVDLEGQLSETLSTLQERHIFQWSTFYPDLLAPLFAKLVHDELEQLRHGRPSRVPPVRRLIADHAYTIAGRGYRYSMRSGQDTRPTAVAKAMSGLQRFLELPIEFYSTTITSITTPQGATALRRICSAFVAGIIEGYGSAHFDEESGWQALARVPRNWAHYVAFLTSDDLASLLPSFEPGTLTDGFTTSVEPVLRAIDELVRERPLNCSLLPVIGQLETDPWRLTIAVEGSSASGARLLEVQCLLDPSTASLAVLEEALGRRVALVVARLRPDIGDWAESRDRFRQLLVNTGQSTVTARGTADRAKDVLGLAVSTEVGGVDTDAPLRFNFAADFPLHNPFLTRYFHVVRPSVRALLKRFDRRNGVRLWCSVRRSGKTTACFDLGTTTGRSTIVTQTCDSTGQDPNADLFYRRVQEALGSGHQLPDSFFLRVVEECSPPRRPNEIRFVFVLDEYETLFERLRLAVRRDAELRYTVAQPLMNQMVAFTRDNLLVLIGQRPDAHFVLMDQNQLSAYVEQDTFPLFEHTTDWSEFAELVRKVATERVPFDGAFADALYAETAGHPFLTVKVMIDYFSWLIAQRRLLRGLRLTEADFRHFHAERLTPSRLGTAQEYQFFSQAISEALSVEGRENTPWLHAVYLTLRQIAIEFGSTLRCSRDEFTALVNGLRIPEEIGYSPEQLLLSGAQANFFWFSDTHVAARIPVLARIASTARPRLAW